MIRRFNELASKGPINSPVPVGISRIPAAIGAGGGRDAIISHRPHILRLVGRRVAQGFYMAVSKKKVGASQMPRPLNGQVKLRFRGGNIGAIHFPVPTIGIGVPLDPWFSGCRLVKQDGFTGHDQLVFVVAAI